MDTSNLLYIIQFALLGLSYGGLLIWFLIKKREFKDVEISQIRIFYIIWLTITMLENILSAIKYAYLDINPTGTFKTPYSILEFLEMTIFSILFWGFLSYMFHENKKGIIIGVFSFVLKIGTNFVNFFLIQYITSQYSSDYLLLSNFLSLIVLSNSLLNLILGFIIIGFVRSSTPFRNHQEFSQSFSLGVIVMIIIYPLIQIAITILIFILAVFTNLLISSDILVYGFFILKLIIPFIGVLGIFIIQKSIFQWIQSKSPEYEPQISSYYSETNENL
ncbi:MAG: hypothetical protein K9W44_01460 [Candidatus Lokiarchaeota archaeon]|nr:hypothetical protein [Candidatus Harpocratesius repetitus]